MYNDEIFTEYGDHSPEANPKVASSGMIHRVVAERVADRTCPDCGAPIVHESACILCVTCGWGRCG
jgi:hypothetical protein